MRIRTRLLVSLTANIPAIVWAAEQLPASTVTVRHVGVSGVWILANFSYAGMRAQASLSRGWRMLAFIFGFPGTLVSLFAVKEGSERAYGVDVPRRQRK